MFSETEHLRDLWSDEDGSHNNNDSDNRVTNTIDSRLYFLIFPSGEYEHETSPDNEEDSTESSNEYNKRNADSDDITSSVIAICINDGSCCYSIWNKRDIHRSKLKVRKIGWERISSLWAEWVCNTGSEDVIKNLLHSDEYFAWFCVFCIRNSEKIHEYRKYKKHSEHEEYTYYGMTDVIDSALYLLFASS
jgi:hypothetical protein